MRETLHARGKKKKEGVPVVAEKKRDTAGRLESIDTGKKGNWGDNPSPKIRVKREGGSLPNDPRKEKIFSRTMEGRSVPPK